MKAAAQYDDDELANLVKTKTVRPVARPVAVKTPQQMASMDDFVQQQILRLPQPVIAKPSNHAEVVGNFMVPVSGARKSSDYGYRNHPVLKKVRLHTGIDYAAPSGTPIYAAESGVVETAGWKGAYGKTVVIKHNERFSTLYGHASKYVVKAGQKVQRGQLIAYVGSTGRSTGPHLHFEVLDGSKRVNPNKYLSQVF
ncbi:M23 family peptidase [Neisseria animalis]|uniref:M23 family peptidase n=2 Tax=Neisseria animalis TaxID=492 RepID=A0A5P3MVH3_NEIAN|nr:M23 family peptidase [Neisseria animalis]ROW33134.1 M23 family metallopeptidase [Neisseria animalis]